MENREIKFRAWNKATEKMSGWDYIHSVRNLHKLMTLNHVVLMQFTGMKDCKGRNIYEGDVLRWTSSNPFSLGEIRQVKVCYVQAQFWCKGDIGVYLAELLTNEKCEIVGNIYENANLSSVGK